LIAAAMNVSNDDRRAIGVVMFCVAVLAFLIGIAGHFKSEYHNRGEISSTGFTIAIILGAIGVVLFLVSLRKKRG
jgi:riboflavin transporter FmnP